MPAAPMRTKLITSAGGVPMPVGWKSPLQGVTLCQVVVERTQDKAHIRVGPAMARQVAEEFCATIKRMIKDGFEKDWSNPHVITVRSS
jgi:hypothetical protein